MPSRRYLSVVAFNDQLCLLQPEVATRSGTAEVGEFGGHLHAAGMTIDRHRQSNTGVYSVARLGETPMQDRAAEWLELAEQARVIANGMRDTRSKTTMMEIATAYERLAALAAERRSAANNT